MTSPDQYVVAGRDLRAFVDDWLDGLETGGSMRGLVDEAAEQAESSDSRYFYSTSFLMANIGPEATSDDATDEQLLLYGVLAAYKSASKQGLFRAMLWESRRAHVDQAFQHVRSIGDTETARALVHSLIQQTMWEPGPDGFQRQQGAKAAAHAQKMSEIEQRDLRASALFDPTIDFDTELLNWDSR